MLNESISPFNDPIFKKTILEKEGKISTDKTDEYTLLSDEVSDDSSGGLIDVTTQFPDLNNIIESAPSLPATAKNMIVDANAVAQNQKEERQKEMNLALTKVFTKYNQVYGTSLQVDFSNLSKTLVDVADPESRRTLELYVSEVFKSMRPVLLLHLISKLSQAMDYVLQPERMFDQNQLTIADLFVVIEKLQQYIVSLNDIVKETSVEDSDQILKRLAKNSGDDEIYSEDNKKTCDAFMKMLKEKGLGSNEDNNE